MPATPLHANAIRSVVLNRVFIGGHSMRILCVVSIVLGLSSLALGHGSTAPNTPATAPCQKDMSFDAWLVGVQKDAFAAGVSRATWQAAESDMTYDAEIIRRDRSQGVFQQSFLQFSDRMASMDRIQKGARLIKQYQNMFNKIEQIYGVPPQVLVAFWGLETDFSKGGGQFDVLSAVTTLAYDCRRAPTFRRELIDALRLIDRGDLRVGSIMGEWAGELGGMQFTPTDYYLYSVDFDGDGRRDLVNSIPDMLASAANFLMNLGWKRGEPWLQEVRVPASMPWEEADLAIQHTRAEWAKWGVKAASGTLPADGQMASLHLPMGRLGPAFLAYPSFRAFLGWNSAMVYATTAAYLSTRIAGAPAISRGNGAVEVLSAQQIKELQTILTRLGYQIGIIDGKLGLGTRAAIKQAQLRVGLPADSYPTVELIERLRRL